MPLTAYTSLSPCDILSRVSHRQVVGKTVIWDNTTKDHGRRAVWRLEHTVEEYTEAILKIQFKGAKQIFKNGDLRGSVAENQNCSWCIKILQKVPLQKQMYLYHRRVKSYYLWDLWQVT